MLATTLPPARRPELVVRATGDGQFVVKDPHARRYYKLGEPEAFLLNALDGRQTAERVCSAFQERFREPLAPAELDEFIQLARSQDFLQRSIPNDDVPVPSSSTRKKRRRSAQDIFFWRVSLYDPDRLFTWLAPRLKFLWTSTFFFASAALIIMAGVIFWTSRHSVFHPLASMVRWEGLLLLWLTILTVTTLHEFAHGLTCKHHGGEVHEIGFLLLFFIPCFYCNVSDAWLLKEKSKRLWVTLAGGYCDLCLWAGAVFLWRLCQPGTLPHDLAWIVASVCGVRVFFNFNPFFKLDGYYLLSDWMDMPNLRRRSVEYVLAHIRWLLWGAARPAGQERGRFLLSFGLARWIVGMLHLALLLVTVFHVVDQRLGLLMLAVLPFVVTLRWKRYLRGFTAGEVANMIKNRHTRRKVWLMLLVTLPAFLFTWQVEDRATGTFRLRPAQRAELRAGVSGFLQLVYFDEGQEVTGGTVIGRIEVPDLTSKLFRKRAEVREAEIKLAMMEAGPRKEEMLEQGQKVARAKNWRNLAASDLDRKRKVLKADLEKLDNRISETKSELDFQTNEFQRARVLHDKQAVAAKQYSEAQKQQEVSQAAFEQALAQKTSRFEQGTLEDEAELARREKELADAQSVLTLMEAGTRPEEIAAQRAQLARLTEEARYLEEVQSKLDIRTSVAGVIATPHLREKVGQFLNEGELICEIVDARELEAEIPLDEQQVTDVRYHQLVELKVRAVPFRTFHGQVDRIAPVVAKNEKVETPATLTIGCKLEDGSSDVRPGMTGYARIYVGPRSLGMIGLNRLFRYVRTEFWW